MTTVAELETKRTQARQALERTRQNDPAIRAAQELQALEVEITQAKEAEERKRLEAKQREIDALQKDLERAFPKIQETLTAITAQMEDFTGRWRPLSAGKDAQVLDLSQARDALTALELLTRNIGHGLAWYKTWRGLQKIGRQK